ncbi:MAG: FAD:protein FMN transferase [SAR86 cluster bacterium]|uniref:FAD:protein FMN transferase n=1 Tax=SAR86 cluster bacterium TaxID=2030880 RepID=A0A937I4V0_9GAMM|nr:FAD:protein FMN transferase [SAR86 cluster bacterium]
MILVANFLKKSLLFFLFFLGACSTNNEILSITGQAFGTFYDIKFEKSNHSLKRVNDEINNIFISINQCCSTYKKDSLVSFKRDNKNTELFNQEIQNYFEDVIKISVKANKTVQGFILFKNYDYFNAVVKGYAVDVVSSKLKELNIKNFFINIGGEIRSEGMKNKNFWKIGIENPLPNQQEIFKPYEFKQSLSIATSGNYRNPGHIVGIRKNKIDQNVLSISVIDKKSTAYADALATGLFALGEVDSIKNNIIDNGIPALLIFKNNEKLQSFESKQWKELLQ